jgi:hypothetical protein
MKKIILPLMLLGFVTSGVYATADEDFEKFATEKVFKDDKYVKVETKKGSATKVAELEEYATRIANFWSLDTTKLNKKNKKALGIIKKGLEKDFVEEWKDSFTLAFHETVEGDENKANLEKPKDTEINTFMKNFGVTDPKMKPEASHVVVGAHFTDAYNAAKNNIDKLKLYVKIYLIRARIPGFEADKKGKVHENFTKEIMGKDKIWDLISKDKELPKISKTLIGDIDYRYFRDELPFYKRYFKHVMRHKIEYGALAGGVAAAGILAAVGWTFRDTIRYKWLGMTLPEGKVAVEAMRLKEIGSEYEKKLRGKMSEKNVQLVIDAAKELEALE